MTTQSNPAGFGAIAWMREHALPLWYERGWDGHRGGFIEGLDQNGDPERERTRRTRVQARQIYVFAHAATLGWHDKAAERALEGFGWFLANCRRGGTGPGFVHAVDPNGKTIDDRLDAYDQAFCLLALAWVYRLTKDSSVKALIDRELLFLDDAIADRQNGGWHEDAVWSLPRRQNPQMHAFEAMLALFEATGEVSYLDRAESFRSLMFSKFRTLDTGAILEFFGPGFSPLSGQTGDLVEPGHHFEWTWLLLKYASLRGQKPDGREIAIFQWALRWGIDASAFVVDQLSSRGETVLSSRRLWPQTEFIKANLAVSALGMDKDAAQRAHAGWSRMLGSYLNVEPQGGWVDRFDSAGKLIDGAMPASSFYHIFSAVAETAAII